MQKRVAWIFFNIKRGLEKTPFRLVNETQMEQKVDMEMK